MKRGGGGVLCRVYDGSSTCGVPVLSAVVSVLFVLAMAVQVFAVLVFVGLGAGYLASRPCDPCCLLLYG